MSSKVLYDMILQASERLQSVLQTDQHANLEDHQTALNLISEYLEIYTMLEECYDQTTQTQRRVNIRNMLQATVTRLLEIVNSVPDPTEGPYSKWELISQEIMAQSQTNDLQIAIPRIVEDSQYATLKSREEEIKKSMQSKAAAEAAEKMNQDPPMPREEAILLVQRAERARRARHETIVKLSLQQTQYKMNRQNKLSDREKSANMIKRFWWKYGARAKEKRLREDEKVLIGMKSTINTRELAAKVAYCMQARKNKQRTQENDLLNQEKIARNWLQDNKATDEMRKFDVVAAAYYNRKKLIRKQMDLKKDVIITLQNEIENGEEEDPGFDEVVTEKIRGIIEEANKKKAKKDDQNQNQKEQKPAASGGGRGKDKVEIPVPETVKVLMEAVDGFDKLWSQEAGADGSDDFSIDLVRKEMWEQMVPELIAQTKEKLTRELKNLKMLDARRCKKARPPRQRQKRQRKVKDPFGGQARNIILDQFVKNGIIKCTPTTSFDDFVGGYNITHPGDFADPDPTDSYAAIKNDVILNAVLPFAADRTQPFIKKSLLITGPKGCGKTTLALSIVHALKALFIDLSPNTLVGKELPAPKTLITQVIAFARGYPYSVILIDDAELMFGGRKIANASKKFKSQFGRNLKKLKAKDGIFLIGTNCDPMSAAGMKLFDVVIKVPPPNYQTRVAIWNHWLTKKLIASPLISVNALAFASQGCTAATIARAVEKAARVKASRPTAPLTDEEILGFIAEAPLKEWGIDEKKGKKGKKK